MLATDWLKVKRPERLLPELLLQPKLDGIRCVADTGTGALFSRTGKPLLGLDHIGKALVLAGSAAAPPAQWVDGEIYRHGASFQGIVGTARRTVNVDKEQAEQLQFHMFDCIGSAPCAVRTQQLHQWLAAATGFVTPGKLQSLCVVATETVRCESVAEVKSTIDAAVDRFVSEGYEGAIGRVSTAPYVERKRSLDLVKAKRFLQEEFAVVSLEERPKQPGIVATVRCITADGHEFGATPECTHAEKQAMWAKRSEYLDGKWVASVRFQELSDGGVPRFPVCAGLRHADDC
jgi:ATP-dependent DNA ligase